MEIPDNTWNPPMFKVAFLCEKKLLVPIMDPAKAYNFLKISYLTKPDWGASDTDCSAKLIY
jgi:hypothetical protein